MSVLFNLKFVQSTLYHLLQTMNLVWASDKIRPSLNIANCPSWSLSLLGSKTKIEGSGNEIVQMTFVQYKTQFLIIPDILMLFSKELDFILKF